MKILAVAASCVLATTWTASATAHGNDAPEHGGQVRQVGDYRLELVVEDDGVDLYVEDELGELTTADATAILTIEAGGQRQTVALEAEGPDNFHAHGLSIPAGARLGVQLVISRSQARIAATFEPREARRP
jgi:hypothetical protein